ncbi:phosphopantetheine-binding protein [Fodinicola feengrottensis]|uniref:phosphopantetheine-binding protein n=1 Tax=Fodinicola feengrottensis TaxID=435914 RepID=UPI0024420E49|nr:phosphopantetheine-binding protein [Fodinicola feengrottensis]
MKESLERTLPAYEVPTAWLLLDRLPLAANGKLDRAGLPAPLRETAYEPPRTDTERTLCDLWSQVLGVQKVGIADDFFDLGGNSLAVARLISRVRAAFGVESCWRARGFPRQYGRKTSRERSSPRARRRCRRCSRRTAAACCRCRCRSSECGSWSSWCPATWRTTPR